LAGLSAQTLAANLCELPVARNGAQHVIRHCEERSDEAIQLFLFDSWIASLRSQ
jgi:hypothetical protein